ncbi:unnamed protein product [Malus baccata var. baccata]
MSDPINWYQSQRSTTELWFAPVDPTLPAPWTNVMDDSSGLTFYWNPETNVSQYEHPNSAPPPPPHPPDHYQIPYDYKPTFHSSDCTYRPPDYPASYMLELSLPPSYTSPIFLPHPAPPSVTYSDSIDGPQIPHSYATNPNFRDPHIYSPSSSYEQNSWVFDSENHLRFYDPHQVFPYGLDQGLDSPVHPAHATGNAFSMVRGVRHTSPKTSLKSVRAKHKLAVGSQVRMKRKAPSMSFHQRRQRNPVLPSFSATPSLPLVPLPHAHEQTSPTNRSTSTPTPIAIQKGTDKHMLIALRQRLDAETLTMGGPEPPGQVLLHKRKTMTKSGHKWARRIQGCKPIFQVRQQRVKWKLFDKGRSFRQSEKDIRNYDVPAAQGYHQFQSDSITLVGDQSWIPLCNFQSNAIQVFDELPKRSIKDAHNIGQVYSVQVIAYQVLAVATLVALVTVKDVVQTGDFDSADGLSSHPRSIHSGRSLYIKRNLMVVVASHYQAIVNVTGLSVCISFASFDQQGCFVAPTSCINVAPYIALFFLDGFANWSNISANLWSTIGLRLVLVTARDTRLVCHISRYKSMVVAAVKILGHYCVISLSSSSSPFKIVMHKFTQDLVWHACEHELNHGFIIGGNLYAKCGLTLTVLVSLLISTRVLRISCAFFDISPESGKWRVAFETMVTLLDDQVRCSLLCKKIIHDDQHTSFILSHNEEAMPLLPPSLLGFSMDLMSMIFWCGMRSLAVINDAHNFFLVNSHLDHAKLLKALIGIKLLDEYWQEKSEATLGNTTVTSTVFPLNACRILTLPRVKRTLSTAIWDWVMKLCIRDDFVGVPLLRDWKYAVLGSSSWSKECAVDRQKSVVVKSSCFGASSSLQSLLHHAHKITEDIFPKLAIDFELSSPKIHAELLTSSAIVYQGSTETEGMKNYPFHFFTSAIPHSESAIRFFTDDIPAFLILNSVTACPRKGLLIATWIWTPRVFVWKTVSKASFAVVDFVRNHGTWRVTPDNKSMICSIVVCICQSSEIPIRSRKRDYSDVHFLEWIHLGDKDAVNFKYILVVPSAVPYVLENYYKTSQPNLMWYAIVLISESFDNNAQRYGSNLQKETKAISQALIHGIMASLAIPRSGFIVGSYRHKVDMQYLIGCITLLETWWQEQSLNSKLIPHTPEFPPAENLGRVEVFNGFVPNYFPYCFGTSNLLTEHEVKAFEDAAEIYILLAHSPDMLLAMKWVLLVQHALSLAIFHAIYLPQELVVGDATKPIVLLLNAVKISVLQLFYSISQYLAKLHDFMLAGYGLMIFVFWEYTLKLILNMSMVHHCPNWLASFPDCCMPLSQFERLEDKPHLKGVGLMRL